MSAVLKSGQKPVWTEILEDLAWERRQNREPHPADIAHIDEADALRYVIEQGEDAAHLLNETVAEIIEDVQALPRLNRLLEAVMERGEDMPAAQLVELVELLRRHMTLSVRGRVQRRIERERL